MGSYPHASHATPFHSSAANPPCPIKIRGVAVLDATDHPTRASGSVQYHIDPYGSPEAGFIVVIPKFATHDHPFHFSAELKVCVSGVTWNNCVPERSVYVFSHIFAQGALDSRIFTSRCVIKTLLLTRRYDCAVWSIGPSDVPPPITPFPLPMNAHTGMVVRPVVAIVVAVVVDDAVTVVAARAPPATSELPFHPTARAPVFIVVTNAALAPLISGKNTAVPLTSVQTRPSAESAIHARDPLPTATHLCPGATVFALEYAVHVIPSADHAIILLVDAAHDAGPVATNRFPFHDTEFAP